MQRFKHFKVQYVITTGRIDIIFVVVKLISIKIIRIYDYRMYFSLNVYLLATITCLDIFLFLGANFIADFKV